MAFQIPAAAGSAMPVNAAPAAKPALDPLDLLNPGKLLPKSGIDAIDTGGPSQEA